MKLSIMKQNMILTKHDFDNYPNYETYTDYDKPLEFDLYPIMTKITRSIDNLKHYYKIM